jgi:hypothetical protein
MPASTGEYLLERLRRQVGDRDSWGYSSVSAAVQRTNTEIEHGAVGDGGHSRA